MRTVPRHVKCKLLPNYLSRVINTHCNTFNNVSSLNAKNYEHSIKTLSKVTVIRRTLFQNSLSNIWDIVKTQSLNPKNPIIDIIISSQNGKSSNTKIDFSRIAIHHFLPAAEKIVSDYEKEIVDLENKLLKSQDIDFDLIAELERISYPMLCMQNLVLVYSMILNDEALYEVNALVQLKHAHSEIIINSLSQLYDYLKTNASMVGTTNEKLRIVEMLLTQCRLHGLVELDEQKRLNVAKLHTNIRELESEFMHQVSMNSSPSPKHVLPLLYEILSRKQAYAQEFGYNTYLEYCIDKNRCTFKDINDVVSMNNGIASKISSLTSSYEFRQKYKSLVLDSSLNFKTYFQLNHVLDILSDLCHDLFGVNIKVDDTIGGSWSNETLNVHIFDAENEANTILATLYIDLLERKDRHQSEFMTPLIDKRKNLFSISDVEKCSSNTPIFAMSLNIKPPVWNDDPVQLTLNDVVALFHEFGHVLESVLVHSNREVQYKIWSGANYIEKDTNEVISQFMEHWLFENPHILTKLLRTTHHDKSVLQEIIKSMNEYRKTKKVYELSHRIFISELEVNLLGKFNPDGEESIVSVQNKLIERHFPADDDIRRKGNIQPLLELFHNHIVGDCGIRHRYLCSEVMCSNIFAMFPFDDDTMESRDKLKASGKSFRKTFLEKGASCNTQEAYESFCKEPILDYNNLLKLYEIK